MKDKAVDKYYTFEVENRKTEYLTVIADSEEEARQKLNDMAIDDFNEPLGEDDYYIHEAILYDLEVF